MPRPRKEILFEIRLPKGYTILDDINTNKIYLDENSNVSIIECEGTKHHHLGDMTVGDARRKFG